MLMVVSNWGVNADCLWYRHTAMGVCCSTIWRSHEKRQRVPKPNEERKVLRT